MYTLYRYRKCNSPTYPKGFVRLHTSHETESKWLITEQQLDNRDLEKYDLVYLGHNMSYETCVSQIDRLIRQKGGSGLLENSF